MKAKKAPPSIHKVRIEHLSEGECMQTLYLGKYDDEPPTIARMHTWAEEQGKSLRGKHHEIYLSDARKVAPEKLKTILRHPLQPAEK